MSTALLRTESLQHFDHRIPCDALGLPIVIPLNEWGWAIVRAPVDLVARPLITDPLDQTQWPHVLSWHGYNLRRDQLHEDYEIVSPRPLFRGCSVYRVRPSL